MSTASPIERVVCCGGIAEKNDLFMQIYADVLGQPMLIAGSPQTPALGAAAVGGGHRGAGRRRLRTLDRGAASHDQREEQAVRSRARARTVVYDELYGIYRELHDAFGGVAGARSDFASLMKRLLALKEQNVVATA